MNEPTTSARSRRVWPMVDAALGRIQGERLAGAKEVLVAALVWQRRKGMAKYGVELCTENSRTVFRGVGGSGLRSAAAGDEPGDLEQELADATMYAVQAVMEAPDPVGAATQVAQALEAVRRVVQGAAWLEDATRRREAPGLISERGGG